MGSGPEVVLLVTVVVIALSGYSALYFATRYQKRSPAVVAGKRQGCFRGQGACTRKAPPRERLYTADRSDQRETC
jgi:hypothetical protein